jgi:hypothetical protein
VNFFEPTRSEYLSNILFSRNAPLLCSPMHKVKQIHSNQTSEPNITTLSAAVFQCAYEKLNWDTEGENVRAELGADAELKQWMRGGFRNLLAQFIQKAHARPNECAATTV